MKRPTLFTCFWGYMFHYTVIMDYLLKEIVCEGKNIKLLGVEGRLS